MTLVLVPQNGLTTKNTQCRVKYESSYTNHSKLMAHVYVFADKQKNGQTDTQKSKNYKSPIYRCGGIKDKFRTILKF